MRRLLAVIVAYFGSRLIFAAIGFQPDVFREPSSVGKLVIGFGVFVVLFWGCYRLLELLRPSRPQDAG